MTDTDRAAFGQCFATLALAQGGPANPEAIDAYFETLRDLPLEAVESAAAQLARTSGDFFPKAGRWYETARRYLPPQAPWWEHCQHAPTCERLVWHELKLAKEAEHLA